MIFQEPPTTRFDLNFRVAGIPVRVHPLFWLVAVLFGATTGDLDRLLVWIVIVFLSILAHELGHALTMRRFGQPAHIVLHAWGGLAVPESVTWGRGWAGVALSPRQEILTLAAGPGAGFAIAAVVLLSSLALGAEFHLTFLGGVLPWVSVTLPLVGRLPNVIVSTILWVNLTWGFINLIPVFPLDGGQIARNAWILADPLDGGMRSVWLSVIAGGVAAVGSLLIFGSLTLAFFFALLAFQSYLTLQGRSNRLY